MSFSSLSEWKILSVIWFFFCFSFSIGDKQIRVGVAKTLEEIQERIEEERKKVVHVA